MTDLQLPAGVKMVQEFGANAGSHQLTPVAEFLILSPILATPWTLEVTTADINACATDTDTYFGTG